MPASDPREHPLMPARMVDAHQDLPQLELDVLERWRQRDVFRASLRARADAQPWVFYEGPPTANGPPGAHHVLSRVFKDIYPRYKTMRGFKVQRKGGWDCHGLPVEIAVERQLGLKSKVEIERYGIQAFNAKCRESVFTYLREWNELTQRIGFWIDLDDAYKTLDEDYIESVWWALAQIDGKGLLYQGHKVVPYCYRCGTALSSHEVALGYREVVDQSVYVQLSLQDVKAPLQQGDKLLVWTTTPWTLPGNVAVAAGPRIQYARARLGEETYVLAAALVQRVLGEHAQILERFPADALLGATYSGPIFDHADRPQSGLPIIAGDFVTTDDGTGLVHIAPAFGEDDFTVAAASGLFHPQDPDTLFNPVAPDGRYRDGVNRYSGRLVKDEQLTEDLIADLDRRQLLFKRLAYQHSYPHCWRCGTPLIYYAKASWYIATTKIASKLTQANETVAWHPPHIKHGRFGDWLRNNVDWALSRERYWGTPLPVWRCPHGHVHVIGSFAELQERSKTQLKDHHRPFVDEVQFPCPHVTALSGEDAPCGAPMQRVPEVIDVWFDSGAMPFAQHHWPIERDDRFTDQFPADFVCEALDQTRGWFYSLLAISTLLFEQAPYKNVVCLGLILDAAGQKMSKSKGNTVDPQQVIDTYGADAFRWYFFTSKQPWDGYRFSEEAIGEGVRLFLKQLWSTYFFYVLYAHANAQRLQADAVAATDLLDKWALSRTSATAELVGQRLDEYDATTAGRAIAELVDDLSNWYVRRSRRRFWDGDPAAFATLRSCLLTVAKLLAPFCPFIADEIYDNLCGALPSVHLARFPHELEQDRDEELEATMAIARLTVKLGLRARAKAQVKVRQPLQQAVVVANGRERAAIERLSHIITDELNVRQLRFVDAADQLGRYQVKANYRRLGPVFGKDMPLVAQAIAALDPQQVASAMLQAQSPQIGISIAGKEHTLEAQDLLLTMSAPDGYAVEREGAHAVALDVAIDQDLREEGLAREVVHAIQNARKDAGLKVEDRISLSLSGPQQLLRAVQAHERYVVGETLASELRLRDHPGTGAQAPAQTAGSTSREEATAAYHQTAQIEGLSLRIALHAVDAAG